MELVKDLCQISATLAKQVPPEERQASSLLRAECQCFPQGRQALCAVERTLTCLNHARPQATLRKFLSQASAEVWPTPPALILHACAPSARPALRPGASPTGGVR